jgi:hypothetical protein
MAGAEVDLDPHSNGFGKIGIGKMHLDVLGGFRPYVPLFTQLLTGQRTKQDGTRTPVSPGDVLWRFTTTKFSPGMGAAYDMGRLGRSQFTGEKVKDVTGHDVTIGNEAARLVSPMFIKDVYDAYQEEGAKGAAIAFPLSFLGGGVQTYDANANSNSTGTNYSSPKSVTNYKRGMTGGLRTRN